MTEPWKALEALGLPTGAIRARPAALDPVLARAAVARCADPRAELPADVREPLLAWLRAWQHHWPASFDEVLGEAGRAALARLDVPGLDANRYLKLRRIAIENLASIL